MKKILFIFILLCALFFVNGCSNSSQKASFYSNGEEVAKLEVKRTTLLQYSSVQSDTDTFGMTATIVGTSNPDQESIDTLVNSDFANILKALVAPVSPIPGVGL